MSLHHGDVVIVDFYPTDPRVKVRPALVVQNDRDNARMQRTIVIVFFNVVSRARIEQWMGRLEYSLRA